jgi:MFS family permease
MRFTERFPALASRDYLIFWTGQFISLIGTWMQNTTLPYLAYRLSGRPLDLGLIGFSATLPTLLLALPGGVWVEHLDRRKTVIVLQAIMMLQALALAALTFSGAIRIGHIVALAFVLGSANAIEITARQSMLVELVGKPALPSAIALQAAIFNLARVLGPSLTALVLLLVKNQGEGWAFLINAASFLFVIIGLFFVRTPFRGLRPALGGGPVDMAAEFGEASRYIRSSTVVLPIILLATLIGFFGFPFGQQIPAIARDVLAVPGQVEAVIKARTSGLYLAQGVGALAAALFISSFSHLRRKGLLMTVGQGTFAVCLALISLARSLPLAVVLICVLGWAMVSQLMMMNTLIQLEVPDGLRGRVFSVYLWGLQGVAPFGSLFIGWLSQTAGVPLAALFCGLTCLLALGIVHGRWPVLRSGAAETPVRSGPAAGT